MLGKLARENEADRCLDLARRDRRLLRVRRELYNRPVSDASLSGNGIHTGGLSGNALEDIVNERVEDGHRLVRDTSIRVDLLQD